MAFSMGKRPNRELVGDESLRCSNELRARDPDGLRARLGRLCAVTMLELPRSKARFAAAPGTSVASKCGSQNQGHFATRHSTLFGELPSQTLNRAKRRPS